MILIFSEKNKMIFIYSEKNKMFLTEGKKIIDSLSGLHRRIHNVEKMSKIARDAKKKLKDAPKNFLFDLMVITCNYYEIKKNPKNNSAGQELNIKYNSLISFGIQKTLGKNLHFI